MRLEGFPVDRLGSHSRLVIVDGLGRVVQQGCYFLAIRYAQSHQSIDSYFGCQLRRRWQHDTVLWLEKCIQFLNEIRIQFHESLVETDVEHRRFLFCQLEAVDALQ